MPAPSGEASFEFEGRKYVLVFDFAAIAFFERESGVSIFDAMAGIERARKSGKSPMASHIAFLVQAGFQRHHPEIDTMEALRMAGDAEVMKSLGVSVEAAMPPADEGNGTAPAETGAGAGTKPSKRRSKRD